MSSLVDCNDPYSSKIWLCQYTTRFNMQSSNDAPALTSFASGTVAWCWKPMSVLSALFDHWWSRGLLGPWGLCQIRVAHAPGTFSPPPRVSVSDMHHGTYVLWCMTGSVTNDFLWSRWHVTGELPAKCQWRGALMFSMICAWINGWVNKREAGDLRCYRAHYDVTVIYC